MAMKMLDGTNIIEPELDRISNGVAETLTVIAIYLPISVSTAFETFLSTNP